MNAGESKQPMDPSPEHPIQPSSTSSETPDAGAPATTVSGPGIDLPPTIMQSSQLTFSSGPLPTPASLAGYGQIDQSFPERIVRMAEEEAKHRGGLERDAIKAEINDSKAAQRLRRVGQWLAFAIAVLFLSAGVWVTLTGHPAVGGIVLGTTLASLVAVFVTGRAPRLLQGISSGSPGTGEPSDGES